MGRGGGYLKYNWMSKEIIKRSFCSRTKDFAPIFVACGIPIQPGSWSPHFKLLHKAQHFSSFFAYRSIHTFFTSSSNIILVVYIRQIVLDHCYTPVQVQGGRSVTLMSKMLHVVTFATFLYFIKRRWCQEQRSWCSMSFSGADDYSHVCQPNIAPLSWYYVMF